MNRRYDGEAKERRFVAYYLANGHNGTKAAIQSGYSERSARTIAWRLKQKPHVANEIKRDHEAQFDAWHRRWMEKTDPEKAAQRMLAKLNMR